MQYTGSHEPYHAYEPYHDHEPLDGQGSRPDLAVTEPPVSRRAKWKRRLQRHPCGFGCGACLLLTLIMIPIAWFAIVPVIAQNVMNGVDFQFTSANISKPTNSSFHLRVFGHVGDTGLPLTASASFPEPLNLIWESLVIGKLRMPTLHIQGSGTDMELESDVTIVDAEYFAESIKFIFWNPSFSWDMAGPLNAHALGLTIPGLHLSKSISLHGLDGMKDISVRSFDLPGNDPAAGIRLNIEADVINPSPMGVTVGDVVFDVFYNSSRLGQVTVPKLTVVPGTNSLSMKGRLIPIESRQDALRLSKLFSSFVSGTQSLVSVVGVSVNASQPVVWLNKAIKGLTIHTPFDGLGKMKVLKSLSMQGIAMTFLVDAPYAPTLAVSQVAAGFDMPIGDFPITVSRVTLDVEVYAHTRFGTLEIPWTTAKGTSELGSVYTAIQDVVLVIDPDKHEVFDHFARDMVLSTSTVDIRMKGTADIVANASIGQFMIEKVGFGDTIPFNGLSSLEDVDIKLLSINIVRGTPTALYVDAHISLVNPSNVHIRTDGYMEFKLFYHGTYIGKARSPPNLDFRPGLNVWTCSAIFEPKEMVFGSQASDLGSAFAMGVLDIPVDVEGHKDSTNVVSLTRAVETVRLTALIPGMQQKLLRRARFELDLRQALSSQTAYASFDIFNIFNEPITVLKMYVTFSFQNESMGHVDEDLSAAPLVMVPHVVTRSQKLLAHFLVGVPSIRGAMSLLGKGLFVEADCFLTAKVGEYPVQLHYFQSDIRVVLEPA